MHPGLYDFAVIERRRQVSSSLARWRLRSPRQHAYEDLAVSDSRTQVREVGAAQPRPRESCLSAVSTQSAAAMTRLRNGSSTAAMNSTT